MTAIDYPHVTADLAERLGVQPKTARNRARALGLGIYVGGRVGYRFSDEDMTRLVESMRTPEPVQRRRGRGRRTAAV